MTRLETEDITRRITIQQIIEATIANQSTGEILKDPDDDISQSNSFLIIDIKTLLKQSNTELIISKLLKIL